MTERQGVEIDYCPRCRGVWLDRGELDKLIERTADVSWPAAASREPWRRERERDWDDDDDDHEWRRDREHQGYGYGPHRRRKKGLLGDLFDFD